jgi:hypothetical protein
VSGYGPEVPSWRVCTSTDPNSSIVARSGGGQENGWNVTEGGLITVPVAASFGVYYAFYAIAFIPMPAPPKTELNTYEFEVFGDIIDPPGPGNPPC